MDMKSGQRGVISEYHDYFVSASVYRIAAFDFE